jgi:hypothetical protein
MPDLSKQLDQLRQRISRIENRGREQEGLPAPASGGAVGSLLFARRADPASRNPAQGREVETESGRH